MICSRLSARCTDVCVNKVSKIFFREFNSIESIVKSNICDIERIIKPCGLFKTKAQNIKEISKIIINKYDGEVPNDFNKLILLPGIGRKTANLVMSEAFNEENIITDTHVCRLSFRLGFHHLKYPIKIEYILKCLIPKKKWTKFCHLLIFHGRKICTSRNPKCDVCVLNSYCNKNGVL